MIVSNTRLNEILARGLLLDRVRRQAAAGIRYAVEHDGFPVTCARCLLRTMRVIP